MKETSILIPVYNHLEFTKRCLDGLNRLLTGVKFESTNYRIIVIDDGSTDGTNNWIKEHHPEVILLQGNGELWWSGGINLGAKHAEKELGSDYILLWNNDIEPVADYFEALDIIIKFLDDSTIVGSKIYYKENKDLIWGYGGTFDPRSGKKEMIGFNNYDGKTFENELEVDWLPGMGTLVPVSSLAKIGYWDEKVFPQYHGDSDFTLRAKKSGYKIWVFPQLKIWNDKSSSGLTHKGSLKGLYLALTDKRSGSQIQKNIQFYKRHATSVFAYRSLFNHYLRFIGGFFKWKILSLFGVKKRS